MARPREEPRTFYLNEVHELLGEAKSGGGALPKLAPVDWVAKGNRLVGALQTVHQKLSRSPDPTKEQRYFLLARPESGVVKESGDKKKAPSGTYVEPVNFAGPLHSRNLDRIGADVISVQDSGDALVHVTLEHFSRLQTLATELSVLGLREQSRWAPIMSFDIAGLDSRVDQEWLASLAHGSPAESVIELQPMLSRAEVDRVFRDIAARLQRKGEALVAAGHDFSGRAWVRSQLTPETVRSLASKYFSVQSIHRRLYTEAAGKPKRGKRTQTIPQVHSQPPERMSVIGVLDGGVPDEHVELARYRRGTFNHPDCSPSPLGNHGSFVASRVVFGELDMEGGLETPVGSFRFLDVRVGAIGNEIETKAVVDALRTCIDAYPDVRVFNLSFSDKQPIASYPQVERQARLTLTQDLDNLAFARDVCIVIAAGNTRAGQQPTPPYPDNYQDADWGLGHWACSFNSLTVGGYTRRAVAHGVAHYAFAPSPFCKVGPGILDAPKPDFSADAGDLDSGYAPSPGLGVWGCLANGDWVDRSGTSFAAPITARACASAIDALAKVCPQGSKPFGATVKAFLAITAETHPLPDRFRELARRTLGRGDASATRLTSPDGRSAVFVWQGVLSSTKETISLQLPVPQGWIHSAGRPTLTVSVSWDTPVNAALRDAYGCRLVHARLRPVADGRAKQPQRKPTAPPRGYPLVVRRYDLKRILALIKKKAEPLPGDIWFLELVYEQIANYPAGMDFTPEQRVGVALELADESDSSVSPQEAVKALPISTSMTRLSSSPVPVRAPVVVTG